MIYMYFGSSLLYACCVFCYVASRLNAAIVTYQSWSNQYFDITPVQYVKTQSAIECCVRCEFDETCSTTNYNAENSECELVPQRPQLGVDLVTRQNWTFYVKPVCFDGGWVDFNQSCYLLVEEQIEWHQADDHCKALGAELVDIHSAEEQTFVYNYHTSNGVSVIWIGLNDIEEEGSFRWSSGRPTTFKAYYPGQPDGLSPQQCVTTLGAHGWLDERCTRSFWFICEKSTI